MSRQIDATFSEHDPHSVGSRVGKILDPAPKGTGVRVGIACAHFNGGITMRLLDSALAALDEHGVAARDITVVWVGGAYELPLAALALADGDEPVDVVLTFGAVIRGDTGHYDLVAGECARGIQDVQLSTRIPVVFGVLTTDTLDQALERSLPDDTNKGREAALTGLSMYALIGPTGLGA
jgi:6,7-dimethyl-8-ribityllumazine synthase